MNLAVEAQVKGDKAIGANTVLTSGGEVDLLGFGAKFRYNTSKLFRLESSYNYLFKKESVSSWDLYLNAHILISLTDKFKVYPLAGIGILGYTYYPVISYDGGRDSYTRRGWKLGGGLDYSITKKLIFNFEYNYIWEALWNDAWGISYFNAGLVYRF